MSETSLPPAARTGIEATNVTVERSGSAARLRRIPVGIESSAARRAKSSEPIDRSRSSRTLPGAADVG